MDTGIFMVDAQHIAPETAEMIAIDTKIIIAMKEKAIAFREGRTPLGVLGTITSDDGKAHWLFFLSLDQLL